MYIPLINFFDSPCFTNMMIVLPGQPVSDKVDNINQAEGVYTRSDKLISSTVGRLQKTDDVSW